MTNNEVTAATAAVRKLIDDTLPGFEAKMVTDEAVKSMVVAALSAAEAVRAAAAS